MPKNYSLGKKVLRELKKVKNTTKRQRGSAQGPGFLDSSPEMPRQHRGIMCAQPLHPAIHSYTNLFRALIHHLVLCSDFLGLAFEFIQQILYIFRTIILIRKAREDYPYVGHIG